MYAAVRLPGITLDAPSIARDADEFPRMDVALFAGFAERGPCHRPVRVNSVAAYQSVFGGAMPLAFDVKSGETLSANLASSVRAFFSNGGTECWVIRVAWTADLANRWDGVDGKATPRATIETAQFPLTGLLARFPKLSNGDSVVVPAVFDAASGGSWADSISVGLKLRRTPVSIHDPSSIPGGFQFADDGRLQLGELIELRDTNKTIRYAKIVVLQEGMAFACWCSSFLVIDGETPVKNGHARLVGRRNRMSAIFREGIESEIVLAGDEPLLMTDRWLQFFQQGESIWLRPDSVDGRRATGKAWQQIASILPENDFTASRLTVDAQTEVNGEAQLLSDLGLTPEAPNSLMDLVGADRFYAMNESRDAREQPNIAAKSQLRENWIQVQSRFGRGLTFDQHAAAFVAGEASASQRRILRSAWLPIAVDGEFAGSSTPAWTSLRPALERDGLVPFDSRLFIDPAFTAVSTDAVLQRAIQMHDLDEKQLLGMHGVFDVPGENVGDVSMLSLPDASQPGWGLLADSISLPPPEAGSPVRGNWFDHSGACMVDAGPELSEPDRSSFLDSGVRLLAEPQIRGPRRPVTDDIFTLRFESSDDEVIFVLEESARHDFADAVEIWRGADGQREIAGRSEGTYYYRLHTQTGDNVSGFAAHRVVVRSSAYTTLAVDPDELRAVHLAMLRLCAGTGEMSAIISLPQSYRSDDAASYLDGFSAQASGASLPTRFSGREARALSYGAVYHPWIDGGRGNKALVLPPDGAVCGIMAEVANREGAWIAPANQPLTDIIGLYPTIAANDHLRLDRARLNLIRRFPRNFAFLAACTLSDETDWQQINVRRLFIMIRRMLLRLGRTYIFEPNDQGVRRAISRSLVTRLDQLQKLGAFSGKRSEDSYFIRTPYDGNDIDNGRLLVELGIAPSHPMKFLDISLVQTGARLTVEEGL
ncbi:phage tail sheath C-terminal domain-containing protein [Parasphingorhabdus sp.]|uniref:phage tail sheath C-terminal domain-containing protein n=1 Tax=Parasphingorhabdus sp. TaxID=2709688 RepID=UPI003C7440EC